MVQKGGELCRKVGEWCRKVVKYPVVLSTCSQKLLKQHDVSGHFCSTCATAGTCVPHAAQLAEGPS